mmetsp:Transcript_74164/g.154691  ORF Transcript_74164/g.154691 Transcript_74164/m.154691 type:complete len:81 (+) Transcript_74164:136-378(+)
MVSPTLATHHRQGGGKSETIASPTVTMTTPSALCALFRRPKASFEARGGSSLLGWFVQGQHRPRRRKFTNAGRRQVNGIY